jgi:pyridoxal phosphate enzyme (YggS family)
MTCFSQRLGDVTARIHRACETYGRDPSTIRLLAVSKRHGLDAVREALAAGQVEFGENFVQEALPKIEATAGTPARWHFIGHLQSNKTALAATHFDWVQTVDRLKIARRLSDQRPFHAPPLQICIQVRIGGEASKAGAEPAAVPDLAAAMRELPRVRLRGLMAIPPPSDDFATQRAYARDLRTLQEGLIAAGFELDTLSIGMSDDLEAAVAEGSTLLRIGTALFGPRRPDRAGEAAPRQIS